MNLTSAAKGMAMGLTVGAITYAVSNATSHQRKKVKSNAGKALKALGEVASGISAIMMR